MILTHSRAFVLNFIRCLSRRRALVLPPELSPTSSACRIRLALLLLWIWLAPLAAWCAGAAVPVSVSAAARTARPGSVTHPALVWIDTDIGDDLDDAFAIALLLRSPQVRVVGISTAFGDTELRARLLDHFLAEARVTDVPVYAGLPTSTTNRFTQRAYAEAFPPRTHPDAISALLAAVHQYGNRLTLLAIGPLFNVAAAIERNPETMHRLGRIVLMGGSIRHGYTRLDGGLTPPAAEWNILQDPPGAQTVFTSGIPIHLYPLDSTQIPLRRPGRLRIFTARTPFAAPLQALYAEWLPYSWNHSPDPTLFDAVAAASILDSGLNSGFCPTQPMMLHVTDEGMTLPLPSSPLPSSPLPSSPSASPMAAASPIQVCLHSSRSAFLDLLFRRLAPAGHP